MYRKLFNVSEFTMILVRQAKVSWAVPSRNSNECFSTRGSVKRAARADRALHVPDKD